MDKAILIFIQENIRADLWTPILMLITNMGHYGAIWIAMTIVLALRPATRHQGILALISLLFCGGIAACIKHLVMRPRPFLQMPDLIPLGHLPHSFSFPSGHTVCAFAAAFILWRTCQGWQRYFFMVFAVIMAFSRLYAGVHYPTDVLAGIIVAFAGSSLVWHFRSTLFSSR
ncbi:putative phosphatase (plasmid) [Selenomonas ruminantium subsp. lactilytica TAM6421]|uniref:Putative phosphatase n=1 Tax=Selenomonas ruminantium subsp. lactilytica (strain NBRC 103574 / TAM6421) TaxID=927704 RepID=I0GVP0_SELRL|nr:phosphatase PAP2 family protein [Selenomonas ruminantium]BAL84827.1 putative phosphatase [Selenomonas ruminantium subsp. lactilytica TAM6421]